MTEARIGRLLVASLHQAIADLLPSRLEFYENWLSSSGLRHGTIGLAPMLAVLSFLRREGEIYGTVVQRAGEHAGTWVAQEVSLARRIWARRLPNRLRLRNVLQLAADAARRSDGGARAFVTMPRDRGLREIRPSLFCEVRAAAPGPLCGFYSGLVARLLETHRIAGSTEILACRAVDARHPGCLVQVHLVPGALWTLDSAGGHDGLSGSIG